MEQSYEQKWLDVVEEVHQKTYHSVTSRRHRKDKPCEICGKVDPLPFDIIKK